MTKKFKTHQKKRRIYTYESSYGPSMTIKPSKDGMTELHIDYLNRLDDHEVESYYRNIRPKRTAKEKSKIEEWKKIYIEEFKAGHGHNPHPEYVKYAVKEKFPMNYTTSLNACENEDKNHLLINAKMMTDAEEDVVDPRVERLREVVQEIVVNEKSQTEVANERGVTKQAINKGVHGIKEKIRKIF